jgi:D-glycero-alpha-D-manno-heptose-7-phosphate kinase
MALLSKTPLRISFLGGGTDYPSYFEKKNGAVLGMGINKYIYVASIELSGIQDYRYRVAYSKLEQVQSVQEIEHPVVRALLIDYKIDEPLDISIMSDMPANSGLGSSSSFTVGLVNLLRTRKNIQMTRLDIALEAIRVERELLGENVGVQDQLHASMGGINRFDLSAESISVTPLIMRAEKLKVLNDSLFLVYTGLRRHASQVMIDQLKSTRSGLIDIQLERMYRLVFEGEKILKESPASDLLNDFSQLLTESWNLKKSLSTTISNSYIDLLCDQCKKAGAIGLKLCGAGGGGFILCIVQEDFQQTFVERMYPQKAIKISMDTDGTAVLHK